MLAVVVLIPMAFWSVVELLLSYESERRYTLPKPPVVHPARRTAIVESRLLVLSARGDGNPGFPTEQYYGCCEKADKEMTITKRGKRNLAGPKDESPPCEMSRIQTVFPAAPGRTLPRRGS